MTTFHVLDAASPGDLARWLALWRRWPEREIMAHPEYARLFARPGDRVVCLAGEDDAGGILFPLLLRPLAVEAWSVAGEERLDAITPYGYGGPFAWGVRDEGAFWRAHAAWCRERRIVSTFVRLSLFPEQLAQPPGRVEVRARNIVVPLAGGAEALWKGYEGKVRKWVRLAERAGLEVELDRTGARLDDFVRVYTHTMERNGADSWYFFPRQFFAQIAERLAGHFAFFHTLSRGEVVSSDLVLCSEEHVYYFLGGTHASAFPLGPNYLLKHRIASWAAEEGKKGYVLGGGYEPDDGLFRYKRAYARHGEVPFRVGCLVHDEAGYAALVAARGAAGGWAPRPGFFPAYRA
ncbi:MAG TPA: GNAT family N-acetyltransferase [Anaeromyxobacteraceae bacterium]